MKYIKTFESFLNEGLLRRTETVVVTNEIEYYIDKKYVNEGGWQNEEDWAETVANDVSLKTGNMEFEGRYFEITGETASGLHLHATQEGEYDMYGGPYTPKMKKPTIKLDGKDMYSKVRKAFDNYGWGSEEIDLSRTDIWGSVIS